MKFHAFVKQKTVRLPTEMFRLKRSEFEQGCWNEYAVNNCVPHKSENYLVMNTGKYG
jgi:hypothetical protein